MEGDALVLAVDEAGTFVLATESSLHEDSDGATWITVRFPNDQPAEEQGLFDVSQEILKLALQRIAGTLRGFYQQMREEVLEDEIARVHEQLRQLVDIEAKAVIDPDREIRRIISTAENRRQGKLAALEWVKERTGDSALPHLPLADVVEHGGRFIALTPVGLQYDVTAQVEPLVSTLIMSAMIPGGAFIRPVAFGTPIQRGPHAVRKSYDDEEVELGRPLGTKPQSLRVFDAAPPRWLNRPKRIRTDAASEAELLAHLDHVLNEELELDGLNERRPNHERPKVKVARQHEISLAEWEGRNPLWLLMDALAKNNVEMRITGLTGSVADRLAAGETVTVNDLTGLTIVVEAVPTETIDVNVHAALRTIGGRWASQPGEPSLLNPHQRVAIGDLEFLLPAPFGAIVVHQVPSLTWLDAVNTSAPATINGVKVQYVKTAEFAARQAARKREVQNQPVARIDVPTAPYPPVLLRFEPDGQDGGGESTVIAMPARVIEGDSEFTSLGPLARAIDITTRLPVTLLDLDNDPIYEVDGGFRTAKLPPGWTVRPDNATGNDLVFAIVDPNDETRALITYDEQAPDGIAKVIVLPRTTPAQARESFALLRERRERAAAAHATIVERHAEQQAERPASGSPKEDFESFFDEEAVLNDLFFSTLSDLRACDEAIRAQRLLRGELAAANAADIGLRLGENALLEQLRWNALHRRVIGEPPLDNPVAYEEWIRAAGRTEELFEAAGVAPNDLEGFLALETKAQPVKNFHGFTMSPSIVRALKETAYATRFVCYSYLPLTWAAELMPSWEKTATAEAEAEAEAEKQAAQKMRGGTVVVRNMQGVDIQVVPAGSNPKLEMPELSGPVGWVSAHSVSVAGSGQNTTVTVQPGGKSPVSAPALGFGKPVLRVPSTFKVVADANRDSPVQLSEGAQLDVKNASRAVRVGVAPRSTVNVTEVANASHARQLELVEFTGPVGKADVHVNSATQLHQVHPMSARDHLRGQPGLVLASESAAKLHNLPTVFKDGAAAQRVLGRTPQQPKGRDDEPGAEEGGGTRRTGPRPGRTGPGGAQNPASPGQGDDARTRLPSRIARRHGGEPPQPRVVTTTAGDGTIPQVSGEQQSSSGRRRPRSMQMPTAAGNSAPAQSAPQARRPGRGGTSSRVAPIPGADGAQPAGAPEIVANGPVELLPPLQVPPVLPSRRDTGRGTTGTPQREAGF